MPPVLGLSSPSAGVGGAGGVPCSGETRGGQDWAPSRRLTCDEPARAQPTAPHGAWLGGSPLPERTRAKQVLAPVRAGSHIPPQPPAGLAPGPLPFTRNEATGWRFGHAAQYGSGSSACANAHSTRPRHPARPPRAKGRSDTPPPRDTLPTWAVRLWRGGCVPAWFTVHGPRDWLA